VGEQSWWPAPPALWDHWTWRPEWHPDRVCLLWYLTFPPQRELWAMASAVHAGLHDVPAVDAVPHDWLHLTLDDVGFTDELSSGHVDAVVEQVRATIHDWQAPTLVLGPVANMTDALVLAAGPAPELVKLRDLLRAATTHVLPEAVSGLDAFLPHVTLAYSNADVAGEVLMNRLAGNVDGQVVLDDYSLVLAAVTRRDRHYQWNAEAVIPLSPEAVATGSVPGRPRPA
jgi:2'-5' RNA ligase